MTRHDAIRILALAIAVGALAAITLPGNALGVNMPLLVVALAAAAVAAAGEAGLRRMDPADAWMAPAAIGFAAMTALRTDPWLVMLDLLVSATLITAAIATLGGARVTRGAVSMVAAWALGAMFAAMAGVAAVLAAAVRRAPVNPDAPAGRRLPAIPARAKPVLRGLMIALPLVLLFTALFSAADAVFGRIAASLLDWHIALDLETLTAQGIVTAVVAWGVAGLLALGAAALPAFTGMTKPVETVGWGPTAATGPAVPRELLETVEATTVLVVLDALFAAFVVLQVAYLFGGRDTLAASGFTYSDYARRGFFELVAVAAIAVSIAVGLDRLVGQRSRAQLGASVAMLALTLVILASALARLRLYQDAYGWTELRFVVLVSIGWLAAAVVATVALLVRNRTQWTLHVLAALALVALGGMNVAGPESFVAEQNLARAANPALVPADGWTGLDLDYFGGLGDEAVPLAIAALPSLSADDRAALESQLAERNYALRAEMRDTGWPSWNLARERTREALAAWDASR